MGKKAKPRAKKTRAKRTEIDQAKVDRLRRRLDSGNLGLDFTKLIDGLAHAMRDKHKQI